MNENVRNENLQSDEAESRDTETGRTDGFTERGGDGPQMDAGTRGNIGTMSGNYETSLLSSDESDRFGGRWQEIQGRFVDDPKEAISEADGLVEEVITKLTSRFSEQRGKLESSWQGGAEPSTEDLRQALQQYRSFFQRLLAA
jgi:hypothetical protein